MFRIISWFFALVACVAVVLVAVLVFTHLAVAQGLVAVATEEQMIDTLRPWVVGLDQLGNHSLFRVSMAVLFMLWVLAFSKKD